MECTGWLLDLYPDRHDGITLWIITLSGRRLRLHQQFLIKFSLAGSPDRLRSAWIWLRQQPIPVELGRDQGRDIFLSEPVTLLTVEVDAAIQSRLFSKLSKAFPDLTYYDADIQLSLRHAAIYNSFPLCPCRITYDSDGEVTSFISLESPWEIDPDPVPLRVLHLEPDLNPQHTDPYSLLVYDDADLSVELPLDNSKKLLQDLAQILNDHDPDILLTKHGDSWILPLLLRMSRALNFPLPLNRDPDQNFIFKKEKSYFSYGVIVYNGQQVHLFGRLHLDKSNSFLFSDADLDGVLENSRVTALPVQVAARTSPGTGISSMQILTALRNHILVPWHKQQTEKTKSAQELVKFDQGGLVYQPTIGLHYNVAEIDFVSMYPSIMVRCNISPEKPAPTRLGSDDEPGLIPLTLKPLLDKRVEIKRRLGELSGSDSRLKRYQSASSSYKWLLVTCFGYLGYKNAKYGRIESHESVTTWGREALLESKEIAEDMGYSILHMYVDALWVVNPMVKTPDMINPLLETISQFTGLSISLDGIYRWIAFLPSKMNKKASVPNRYFGVFQDGSIKYRGIEARRHDYPQFVKNVQIELIHLLGSARTPTQLNNAIQDAQDRLHKRVSDLRDGKVPLQDLVISQRISREIEAYKSPPPAIRALKQLLSVGKTKRPGQRVSFIFAHTPDGVYAWDMPQKIRTEKIDISQYEKLVLRAAKTIFEPFGYAPTLEKVTTYQMKLRLNE